MDKKLEALLKEIQAHAQLKRIAEDDNDVKGAQRHEAIINKLEDELDKLGRGKHD